MSHWAHIVGVISVDNPKRRNPTEILRDVLSDAPKGSEGPMIGKLINESEGGHVNIALNCSLRDHSHEPNPAYQKGPDDIEDWIKRVEKRHIVMNCHILADYTYHVEVFVQSSWKSPTVNLRVWDWNWRDHK